MTHHEGYVGISVVEFELRTVKAMGDHPTWRYGQTYFNVLSDVRPHLAEAIRGTAVDPFNDDRIVPQTKAWIREHWEDPVPEGFVKPTPEELIARVFNKVFEVFE